MNLVGVNFRNFLNLHAGESKALDLRTSLSDLLTYPTISVTPQIAVSGYRRGPQLLPFFYLLYCLEQPFHEIQPLI